MKCLSVQQPWAWAIIHGPKRIENRSWPTNYRVRLLIHAGKATTRLGDYGEGEPLISEMDFGAIIGSVELVNCVRWNLVRNERFAEGPWCWLLSDRIAFQKPIPYRGAQGLFDVPDAIVGHAQPKSAGLFDAGRAAILE